MSKLTSLTVETFSHWQKNNASRMGAAISYYAIFSIAPLFILLITLVRIIFDQQTVNTVIGHSLKTIVGSNLSSSIQTLITGTGYTHTGFFTSVISGIVLIIVALSVFAELNNDLDELWKIPSHDDNKPISTSKAIMAFIKERLTAFFLILLCGLLLLFSVAFTVLISFFHVASLPGFLTTHTGIQITDSFLTIFFTTILFSLIYKILPNTKLPTREIVFGAFITSLLFLFGKFLIGWYINAFGGTSSFGTAGSVVGLLLWVYYSAQVFLIGASFTIVNSKLYGYLSRKKNS
jgi:membrane protein